MKGMIEWVRGRIPRPSRAAIDRAAATSDRLDRIVDRRQRESDETVDREATRRQRLSGAFIFDVMDQGVIREDHQ